MKRSYCHRSTKDFIAHYMSPLHLCSPIIRLSYRVEHRGVKRILKRVVLEYDRIYRAFLY